MEQTFLTGINIKKVRHLSDISIPLSDEKRKHLILTGKNGSGKTSVMEALVSHIKINFLSSANRYGVAKDGIRKANDVLERLKDALDLEENIRMKEDANYQLKHWKTELARWNFDIMADCQSFSLLRNKYFHGQLVLAYYSADRKFFVQKYKNIEKVELKDYYELNDIANESAGSLLTKYLVDLKATQAFSKDNEKIQRINEWFERFESILQMVFDDKNLRLIFNEETFQFTIHETGREPFDFNTMSSGYAAVLDIINDLIMRMEAQSRLRVNFDMEGIVLIDEIETHLHLELQKKILPMLTTLFPNIQFIVSTHSPFILNSLDNAVIYDLEKRMLVSNGMKNLPYEGIVEGYFGADRLSEELRNKYERYKVLVSKNELSDEEYAEIDELEYYLDEIPDYLATEIATEYSRLKLEFSNREQLHD